MAYTEKIYKSPVCIEHEMYFAGNYGAKGEKRAKKSKPSPEGVKKTNHRNKVDRIRRLIQMNFVDGYFLTLTYPAGNRPTIDQVKKNLHYFFEKSRPAYKKNNMLLKFISRIEIGKRGGVHCHICINRLDGITATMSEVWRKITGGNIHYEHIKDKYNDHFQTLAEYICKETPEEVKPEGEKERKATIVVSTSRNLKRPVPVKKKYTHWTVRQLIEDGAAEINARNNSRYITPGYMIDLKTWETGINEYTGLSYIRYTEIPIPRKRKSNF